MVLKVEAGTAIRTARDFAMTAQQPTSLAGAIAPAKQGMGDLIEVLKWVSQIVNSPVIQAVTQQYLGRMGYAAAGMDSMDPRTAIPNRSPPEGLPIRAISEPPREVQVMNPTAIADIVKAKFGNMKLAEALAIMNKVSGEIIEKDPDATIGQVIDQLLPLIQMVMK
jgi:hypothetical protein